MDKKIFVFDVDGTLADCSARQVYLRFKPRNWKTFKDKILEDGPHHDVIWMMQLFTSLGHTVLIATGREEQERANTEAWFSKHGITGNYLEMFMRENGDYRDDSIVKKEMLDHIRDKYGEPFMVFDDRDRVVKMWRENGVRCMQVAYGDF